MNEEKYVRVDSVSHAFDGTGSLFTDLDLTLYCGEIVGLVGPSGSGKSTLLSILAGWVVPRAGSIVRVGVEHTGWVFQNPHGVARRTALDHVVLPLLARGARRREAEARALDLMDEFELQHVAHRQFRALSGGEAQRLMLARAVALAPDLLLVDEPTAQLDLATAATVSRVLSGIAHDSSIVVVATHDPSTQDACTRVVNLVDYQVDIGLRAVTESGPHRPSERETEGRGVESAGSRGALS